jgi:hypothetical protein
MRCYLMKRGHIASVTPLPGVTDDMAVAKCHQILAASAKDRFDGFEVWDMARFILRYPADGAPDSPTTSEA